MELVVNIINFGGGIWFLLQILNSVTVAWKQPLAVCNINERMWLCSNKTSFTKTGGRQHFGHVLKIVSACHEFVDYLTTSSNECTWWVQFIYQFLFEIREMTTEEYQSDTMYLAFKWWREPWSVDGFEAEKWNLLQSLYKEHSLTATLILAQWDPYWTSRLLNYKIANLYCLRHCLWQFTTVAIKTNIINNKVGFDFGERSICFSVFSLCFSVHGTYARARTHTLI